MTLIAVDAVTKRFRGLVAVDGVSFVVEAGERPFAERVAHFQCALAEGDVVGLEPVKYWSAAP